MRSARTLVVIATAVLAAGCSEPVQPTASAPPMPKAGAMPTSPQPSPTEEPTPGAPVAFRTLDGVRIAGRVFGNGRVGVVLGHQIDGDQRDWWSFAEELADDGYRALTIDFRGTARAKAPAAPATAGPPMRGATSPRRRSGSAAAARVGSSWSARAWAGPRPRSPARMADPPWTA